MENITEGLKPKNPVSMKALVRNQLSYNIPTPSTPLSLQNVTSDSPIKRSCHHSLFKVITGQCSSSARPCFSSSTQGKRKYSGLQPRRTPFISSQRFPSHDQIGSITPPDKVTMHTSDIIWKVWRISPLKGTNLSMPLEENNFLNLKKWLKYGALSSPKSQWELKL